MAYLRKTETEIEKDLYRLVKGSSLATLIGGSIYRRQMRPRDARSEDIVLTFVSGEESQEQNGIINLNVYVPMMSAGLGTNMVQDISRCETIERAIIDFIEGIDSTEYIFELRSAPITLDDPEYIDQTTINSRIFYRRTTF